MQRELGLRASAAHTMTQVAAVVLVRGNAFQALGIARQALATALAVEARAAELAARLLLGEAELALGHATDAEAAFAAALTTAQVMDSGRQWSAHAGLARRHPSLIAGVLYRDFTRGRDDVTVVAVTAPPARPARPPGEE